MRFLILVLMLAGCGEPARADLTAHYRHIDGQGTVRVEVAGNGDAQFQMSGQPWRLIHRGGVSYVVYSLPGGPVVARIDDLQRLAVERGGETPAPPMAGMRIIDRGETRMGSYSGRAYHLATPAGISPRPQFVISRDPALAAIGPVWLRQIDFSIAMLRRRGAPVPANILQVREIMASGTPVYYGGQQLERVERGAIPAERFRLPAEPMTLEQLRSGDARVLFGPAV